MKPNPGDKPKIIVLSIILAAVLAVIAIRYVQLSRQWTAKIEAHEKAHEAAAIQAQRQASTSPGAPSRSSRVAALVTPVPPPTRDPFYPVIAPRMVLGECNSTMIFPLDKLLLPSRPPFHILHSLCVSPPVRAIQQ